MTCQELEIKTLNSIDEIGRQSINSLGCDGFHTYEWLKTLEKAQPFRILPQHFIVSEDMRLEAIALCFLEYSSQYRTVEELFPFSRTLRRLGSHFGLGENPPLVCYSPSSFQSKILFAECSNQREILHSLSERIDDFCAENKILMSCFPYVSQFDKLLMNNLPVFGYLGSPVADTYYLDVEWPSFLGYLESLGCNMRHNVRREIRKCKDEGIVIQREEDIKRLSEELSHLYNNLYQKYNRGRLCPLNDKFFNGLGDNGGQKVRLMTARKNGKLVGFCISLCHSHTLDVFMTGFDYDCRTRTDSTYFNLCYYKQIEMAIEEGVKKIHFRGASDEAKLRRGCRRERMYMYTKIQNPILRPMISQYMRLMNNMRNRGMRMPSSNVLANLAIFN
jgi:predicted N-acyltransferase